MNQEKHFLSIEYFNIKDKIYNVKKNNNKKNNNIINNIIYNSLNKIEKSLCQIKKNKVNLFSFIIIIPNEWNIQKHFMTLYNIFYKDSFIDIYKITFDFTTQNIIIISNEITEKIYYNNIIKYEIKHASLETKCIIDSIIINNFLLSSNINTNTKKDIQNTNIIKYSDNELYLFVIYFGGIIINYDIIEDFLNNYIQCIINKINEVLKIKYNITIIIYWRLRYKDNIFTYKHFFSEKNNNMYFEGIERDIIIINKKLNITSMNIEDICYTNPRVSVYSKDIVNIEIKNSLIYKLKNTWKIYLELDPIIYSSLESILLRLYDEIFNLENIERKYAIYLICKFNFRITNENNKNMPINSKSYSFIKKSQKIICFWPVINPGHGAIKYIVTNNIIKEYNELYTDDYITGDVINISNEENNDDLINCYKNIDMDNNIINDNKISEDINNDKILEDINNNNLNACKLKNDIKLNNLIQKYNKEDKIIGQLNLKQKNLKLKCTTYSELFEH